MKNFLITAVLAAVALTAIGITGCASRPEEAGSLMVYSGAGMRKPMDEIGMKFHQRYGTEISYNYAGSNALLSQMELTREGDVYMPGETMYMEIAAEKGFVEYQKLVCYHIPVITVPRGNPAGITRLEDLGIAGVKIILGDPEVAAIGKTAEKIFDKSGLRDKVWANITAMLPTMNEVMLQIAMGQADASINWWDTVKSVEEIETIEIPKEQNVIEIIPIGTTSFTGSPETARRFVDFCVSEEGKRIFEKHGFTPYPDPDYENR